MSVISIFEIINIITHKSILCTNKICAIYFCPNCVNVLYEGGVTAPASTSLCPYGNKTFCNEPVFCNLY